MLKDVHSVYISSHANVTGKEQEGDSNSDLSVQGKGQQHWPQCTLSEQSEDFFGEMASGDIGFRTPIWTFPLGGVTTSVVCSGSLDHISL